MENYEIIDGGQEIYPEEVVEVVEEVVDPIDYTEQIYDCTNSIITVLLFAAFAIIGFFSAIQMFGRTKA